MNTHIAKKSLLGIVIFEVNFYFLSYSTKLESGQKFCAQLLSLAFNFFRIACSFQARSWGIMELDSILLLTSFACHATRNNLQKAKYSSCY